MNCNGVCITLGKETESVTTVLAQTGHWQKWPSLVWLHWDDQNEQEKSIKELGDHITNLHREASKTDMADYLFDKHTLGNWWELSLRLTSHSQGGDFPGHQSNMWMLELPLPFLELVSYHPPMSFICTTPSNKVIWYPSPKKENTLEKSLAVP